MEFEVEVDGCEQIQELLKKLSMKIKSKELLEEIANPIYNATIKAFEDQASPFGKKWQELSPATIKAKTEVPKKKGKKKNTAPKVRGKILHDAGELQDSFSISVNDKTALVGSSKDYAAIHQFGGRAGRNLSVDMPARPFFPITKDGKLPQKLETLLIKNLEEMLME